MSSNRSLNHLAFMQRALELAARGKGWVSPNPCVGAVIVNKGRIVGEGYHARFGGPHAEIMAIAKAGPKAKGGTLYITLEPCTHWGKTPPCAPNVIAAGIKTAYIATTDPNPVVAGRGVKLLKKAGVRVHVGLERHAAERLNRAYILWRRKNRPYIILKTAMSLDGKIATSTGDSRWITSPAARELGHRLRAESDAILVGASTVAKDNPELTSHGAGRNPLRIVLDPRLRLSASRRLYASQPGRTLIVTGPKSDSAKAELLKKRGVQILRSPLKFNKFDLKNIVNSLSKLNVSQLLVEGGGETAWTFIERGLVDEAFVFVAPVFIGGREAPTAVSGTGFTRLRKAFRMPLMSGARVGSDILLHAWRKAA